MTENSLEYIEAMARSYDVDYYELRKAVVFFVQTHSREESVILYYRLCVIDSEDEQYYYSTALIDILDQMTGYCGMASIIGSGDYDKIC